MSIKPILFYTDMVRALLANRKTVTRRVVKMPAAVTSKTVDRVCVKDGAAHFSWSWSEAFSGFDVKMPYRPGDILYVRETFFRDVGRYLYKANYSDTEKFYRDGKEVAIKWRPSIHMPREAARIFLRVTDVRVEQLQQISSDDCILEGVPGANKHFPVGNMGLFSELWNSTIKPSDRAQYGWAANPWVWVIEFERISREEAEDGLQRAD